MVATHSAWEPLRKPVAKLVERGVRAKANPITIRRRTAFSIMAARCRAGRRGALARRTAGRAHSRNLVNVFLLAEELKRRGKKHEHNIERVHVVARA